MKPITGGRRDRVRAMLADLKMPGALEAVDGILAQADSGAATAGEAIEQLFGAQIVLRNNRRLDFAMRSSRLPAVKTLAHFDFAFQPSIKREQIASLHELGFLRRARGERRPAGSAGSGQDAHRHQAGDRRRRVRTARVLRHVRGAGRVARRGPDGGQPGAPPHGADASRAASN